MTFGQMLRPAVEAQECAVEFNHKRAAIRFSDVPVCNAAISAALVD